MKPKIVITEPDWLPDGIENKLAEVFDILMGPYSRETLIEELKKVDGALVGLDHVLKEDSLPPNLKFIVSPTTGLNHIDLAQAERQGTRIISLKGEAEFLEQITATAELCWGLILALLRRIPQHNTRIVLLFLRLRGYGHAFGMRVMACDNKTIEIEGVEQCDLHAVLREADIVSLQADSRRENYHMIGAEEFKNMKDGALFIGGIAIRQIGGSRFGRA